MAEATEENCICKRPYTGEFMVCCDVCQRWYHPDCIGFKGVKGEAQVKKMATFKCKFCVENSAKSVARDGGDNKKKAKSPKKHDLTPVKSGLPTEPLTDKKQKVMPESPAAGVAKPVAVIRAPVADGKTQRDSIKGVITEALAHAIPRERAEKIASDLDEALINKYGQDTAKTRLKELLLPNLKRNAELVKRLESGEVTIDKLIVMEADDLASSELKEFKTRKYEESKAQTIKRDVESAYVYTDSGLVQVVQGKIEASIAPAAVVAQSSSELIKPVLPPTVLPPTTTVAPTATPILGAVAWNGMLGREGDDAFAVSLRQVGHPDADVASITSFQGVKKIQMVKKLKNEYFRKHIQQLKADKGSSFHTIVYEVTSDDEAKYKSIYQYLVDRDSVGMTEAIGHNGPTNIKQSFLVATSNDTILNSLSLSDRQRHQIVFVVLHFTEDESDMDEDTAAPVQSEVPKLEPQPVQVPQPVQQPFASGPYVAPPMEPAQPKFQPQYNMPPPGAVPVGYQPPPPFAGGFPAPAGYPPAPYGAQYQPPPQYPPQFYQGYTAPPPSSGTSLLGAGPASTLRH